MKFVYKILSLTMSLIIIISFSACKKTPEESSSVFDIVSEKEYTVSEAEDGTLFILDESGDIVEGAVVKENGSVEITNSKTGKTEIIPADRVNLPVISSTSSMVDNITASAVDSQSIDSTANNNQANNNSSSPSTGTSSNLTKPDNSNSSISTTSSNNPTSSTTSPITPQKPDESQTSADNQKLTTLTASEIKEMESYFLELVNAERQRVGIQPLIRNDALDKAAKIRVEETFIKMGHTRPDGTDYFTIFNDVKYGTPVENTWSPDGVNWRTDIEYVCGVNGENLAGDYNSDRRDIKIITEGFFTNLKNSSGHYQNMLGKSFNKTGIAISSIIDDNLLKCHIIQIFTER